MSLSLQRLKLVDKLLLFCLFVIPMGTALQNGASALFFIAAVAVLIRQRKSAIKLSKEEFLPLLIALLYIIWQLLASMLNPKNDFSSPLAFFLGYAPFFVLPYFCRWAVPDGKTVFQIFEKYLPYLMLAWFLICWSQAIWGWSLMRELGHPQNFRPQGLYSHPLSVAYAALIFWPYCLFRLLNNWRLPLSWLLAASNFGIIILTASRTCLAAALLAVLWVILRHLKGRYFLGASAIGLLVVLGLGLTDNHVSDKIRATIQASDPDRFSSYPDDRIAFWHAHYKMIEERPILGHGAHLDTAYRSPYYEKIGLSEFRKKYNAHNQFIQVMTTGGLIGLLLFLGIFISLQYLIAHRLTEPWQSSFFSLSLAMFLLASLTQNAFDDAVVRYCLTLMICWLYVLIAQTAER